MKKYIVQIILQSIIWTGPKLTPKEAADILRPNQNVYYPTYDGPKVIMINESWANIPPLDYPTRGLYYGYYWRYNAYQTRAYYPKTTFRGFGSQMQNRKFIPQYQRRYKGNR